MSRLFECPDCGITSHNENDEKNSYCSNCKKFFNMHDYVKVTFEFRGKTSEEMLHLNQAWEVAQAMKRMNQERLQEFMEHHRIHEPEMLQGFMRLRRPLNKVGINPR